MNKVTSLASLAMISIAVITACQSADTVTSKPFGKVDGKQVKLYTLKNKNGMVAKITNYGGIVTELYAPDRNGKMGDVLLGYDNVAGYVKKTPYFNAVIGRYGNRIGNHKFTLNGKTYTLEDNNNTASLHGGKKGFDKRIFSAKPIKTAQGPAVELTYLSKDGEEGYPGNLKVTVRYTLTDSNELRIDYRATTDKATPVNLTQHNYYNLADAGKGSINNHVLMIKARKMTPVDKYLVPTGKYLAVKGTPFDFTKPTRIGDRVDSKHPQMIIGPKPGYDHNWVLDKGITKKPELCATLYAPSTGRFMKVLPTEPGLQFYGGNFLEGKITGKNGTTFQHRTGLCLETQHYPDSPNKPNFPTTILKPGQVYKSTTIYKFETRPANKPKPAVKVTMTKPKSNYKPVKGKIMSRWAKEVSPENALPEYPRPQMVRKDRWTNLNGMWDYAITPKKGAMPKSYDGEILVPYCVESALSGVKKTVGQHKYLWYRRNINVEKLPAGERFLLNFGAVDWQTVVYVNGQKIGKHEGGYDPFSFDITDQLKPGKNEIIVRVWDPTDKSYQPRGKQVETPKAIWYTPVTGIWQTVWLEQVPAAHIENVKVTPSVKNSKLAVIVKASNADKNATVKLTAKENGKVVATATGKPGQLIDLKMTKPKLWSPDSPFLYDLDVELTSNGKTDRVESYFGMREIEMRKASDGYNRIYLNGKCIFPLGPLDQGWWPGGLYTAPTDDALKFDIEMTRKMGFNMARKHVKVEPARWYYWCDKLGLLVWQDMPNGDKHIWGNQPDIRRTPASEACFRREWKAIMEANHNFPSIFMWTPFNEGWGQFKTNEILAWTKKLDPSRLIDGPSGWTDRGGGEAYDKHAYPGPGMFPAQLNRLSVLGEFGGLGHVVRGHLWQENKNWGYRNIANREEFARRYETLMIRMLPLIGKGLSSAVYTQTTDVEIEVNGLMTYDRAVIKIDPARLRKIHAKVLGAPPKISVVIPAAEDTKTPATWKYTMKKPAGMWFAENFDDSKWKSGKAAFGNYHRPDPLVKTKWRTKKIWIRRTFELKEIPSGKIGLKIRNDDDARVYINGKLVIAKTDYNPQYTVFDNPSIAKALRKGKNTIAIYATQNRGGQFVDAGIVTIKPGKPIK